jgi:hypothetical protein
MVLISANLLARATARHAGEHAASGAFWFALVYLNFGPAAYRGFQLETVQAFFASVAAYFALLHVDNDVETHRSAFLTGLFAGVAAMLKPTAAAVAGASLLTLLHARRWRAILPLLLGSLVAPVAVAVWTWRAGLFPEMPALFREIALYGRETPLVALDWVKPITVLLIAGFPFLAARALRGGMGKLVRPWSFSDARVAAKARFILFAATWLTLEFLGILLQRRMYAYHFLVLAPPLALLFGLVWRDARPAARLAAFAPVIALSLFANVADFRTLLSTGVRDLPESEYLRAHAVPTDRVVGDGIERLLMESGLRAGSRYLHLFYLTNHDTAPIDYTRQFLADLEKNRPEWAIFDTRRDEHHLRQCEDLPMLSQRPARRERFLAAWRDIDAYIAQHYRCVATVNGKSIYRRTGDIRIISSSRPSSYPRRPEGY